jgi:hypothetical protein
MNVVDKAMLYCMVTDRDWDANGLKKLEKVKKELSKYTR